MYDLAQTVLFYLIFKYKGIHAALISVMIMSIGSIGYSFIRKKEISKIQLFSTIIITFSVVFSILFKNPAIFQYKTSVMYVLFSGFLFLWPIIKKETLLELLIKQRNLNAQPNISYKKLNNIIAAIFLGASAINLYVIQTRTLEDWVTFKMKLAFWMTLMILGIVGYSFYTPKKKDKDQNVSTLS